MSISFASRYTRGPGGYFVFHDGQNFRLSNPIAVRRDGRDGGNAASLTLTNRSCPCGSLGKRVKELSIMGSS